MSGVYFPNLKLPKWCKNCDLVMDLKATMYCPVLDNFIDFEDMPKTVGCPGIPVPDHGRLIDADALCEGLVSNHPVVIHAKCAPHHYPRRQGGRYMNKPESLCDRCDKYTSCLLNYDGPACRRNRTTQPTNADRIRAMSDEELAQWAFDNKGCPPDRGYPDCDTVFAELDNKCPSCWLEWMKKEADNG